ncbi:hypothetical protein [Emticicia sp. 17c]|uniref:hypothetical protein n=1 Tax=Emticicia sp. 17c TaxID=3127704 RepID=UPI00301D8B53
MRFQLIITFLFFTAQLSLAQKNFVKGSIITAEKDTLSGYIDYREWIISPTEIAFRKTPDQTSTVYSHTQLAGFIIDSSHETYHSLNFDIEYFPRSNHKTMFNNMKEYARRNKQIVQRSAFVRVLSEGKATLYHFVDKDSEAHFLIKYGDTLEALVYHIIETKHYNATFRQYQTQLANLLTDACKKLSFYQTDYYVNNMRKLIDSYNDCFRTTPKTTPVATGGGRLEYGLMAGAGYTRLKHVFATPFRNYTVKGDANITPVGALFLNYVFARGRGRFAVMNELHTYYLKSNATYDNQFYHYDMPYLGMQHLFRYGVLAGQPSLYLTAGLSYAFIIKQKSYIIRWDGSIENFSSYTLRNDEQRLLLGLGTTYKRLSLEARYARGNGYSTGASTTIPNNRIDLWLKLNFGKIGR